MSVVVGHGVFMGLGDFFAFWVFRELTKGFRVCFVPWLMVLSKTILVEGAFGDNTTNGRFLHIKCLNYLYYIYIK